VNGEIMSRSIATASADEDRARHLRVHMPVVDRVLADGDANLLVGIRCYGDPETLPTARRLNLFPTQPGCLATTPEAMSVPACYRWPQRCSRRKEGAETGMGPVLLRGRHTTLRAHDNYYRDLDDIGGEEKSGFGVSSEIFNLCRIFSKGFYTDPRLLTGSGMLFWSLPRTRIASPINCTGRWDNCLVNDVDVCPFGGVPPQGHRVFAG
jgi:hypothetical protein